MSVRDAERRDAEGREKGRCEYCGKDERKGEGLRGWCKKEGSWCELREGREEEEGVKGGARRYWWVLREG